MRLAARKGGVQTPDKVLAFGGDFCIPDLFIANQWLLCAAAENPFAAAFSFDPIAFCL
ncbi:hypothetical protein SAMN04490248_109100 [Salinihabitans flavidus]|uniref:Uncharacterized protein n=1 Tax=Salinihabitans flavidus TaxID=569882 RepID=A0A1H8RRP9_9RHOB|nr:hypothetical protein SAMN04490248_109100 [Salinihabitans flavidus]